MVEEADSKGGMEGVAVVEGGVGGSGAGVVVEASLEGEEEGGAMEVDGDAT